MRDYVGGNYLWKRASDQIRSRTDFGVFRHLIPAVANWTFPSPCVCQRWKVECQRLHRLQSSKVIGRLLGGQRPMSRFCADCEAAAKGVVEVRYFGWELWSPHCSLGTVRSCWLGRGSRRGADHTSDMRTWWSRGSEAPAKARVVEVRYFGSELWSPHCRLGTVRSCWFGRRSRRGAGHTSDMQTWWARHSDAAAKRRALDIRKFGSGLWSSHCSLAHGAVTASCRRTWMTWTLAHARRGPSFFWQPAVLQTPWVPTVLPRDLTGGVTQNPDFDRRGLLVNIDNQIIPVRTTECERQSSQNGADGYFDEPLMNQRNLLQFQRSAQTKARMKNRA